MLDTKTHSKDGERPDTIKMFRKPREESEERNHTENKALKTVLRRAEGGCRGEVQRDSQWKEQP